MDLSKNHLCRSKAGNSFPYKPIAVQRLPSVKKLEMPWSKLGLAIFCLFPSKRRESSKKWPFCTFGRKQCFCLNYLPQELIGIKKTRVETSKY